MGLAEAGCGVKRDLDLTFEWYHKAAEQGNGWAQYALGHLLTVITHLTMRCVMLLLKYLK